MELLIIMSPGYLNSFIHTSRRRACPAKNHAESYWSHIFQLILTQPLFRSSGFNIHTPCGTWQLIWQNKWQPPPPGLFRCVMHSVFLRVIIALQLSDAYYCHFKYRTLHTAQYLEKVIVHFSIDIRGEVWMVGKDFNNNG